MCGHPEGDRFANLIASAPNLKRQTLLEVEAGLYMKQIADNVDRFQLEDIHYGHDSMTCMLVEPIEAEFRAVLRGQRTTLKKLTLSRVATGPDVDLLRFTIDADLSALEEITIDNVYEWRGMKDLRFVHTPGEPLVSASSGGNLVHTLCEFGDGAQYYDKVSYAGPGIADVLEQLVGNARLVQCVGSEQVRDEGDYGF
jgi:hypothetical protein